MPISPTGSDGLGTGEGGRPLTPQEQAAFQARTRELGARLDKARGAGMTKPFARSGDDGSLMGRALSISSMLIGTLIVGSAIGWGLDQYFGTWPKLFVAFFLLGALAGIVGVIRSGMAMRTGPANPNAGPSVRDDDDET